MELIQIRQGQFYGAHNERQRQVQGAHKESFTWLSKGRQGQFQGAHKDRQGYSSFMELLKIQ